MDLHPHTYEPKAQRAQLAAVTSGSRPAYIENKILEKLANKFKRGSVDRLLHKLFSEYDGDGDGFISFPEFHRAMEHFITENEARIIFNFWDATATNGHPRGAVEVVAAVSDMMQNLPEFNSGFNTMSAPGYDEQPPHRRSHNKGNQPSQSGGIFDGGAHAEAARSASGTEPISPQKQQVIARCNKSNASSLLGASFAGPEEESRPLPTVADRTDANKPSEPGGIFSFALEGPPSRPPTNASEDRQHSNRSSVQGGIFSEDPALQPPPPMSGRSDRFRPSEEGASFSSLAWTTPPTPNTPHRHRCPLTQAVSSARARRT